ncbi:MAG: zf-HC2 domain-containing protein [Bacteroidota bacterium]
MALNKDEHSECEKFIELISLMLDNEASSEEEEYLAQHVDDSAPCLEKLESEKEYREMLKKKIGMKEVPVDLINAIKTKIKSLV